MVIFSLQPALALPLYRVTKGTAVSYILGTNHSLPASVLPHWIRKKVERSRIVLGEAAEAQGLQGGLDSEIYNSVDNKKLLGPMAWIQLKRVFESQNRSIEVFRRWQPLAAFWQVFDVFEQYDTSIHLDGLRDYINQLKESDSPADKATLETIRSAMERRRLTQGHSQMDDEIEGWARAAGIRTINLDKETLFELFNKIVTPISLKKYVVWKLRNKPTREAWQRRYRENIDWLEARLDSGEKFYLNWTPQSKDPGELRKPGDQDDLFFLTVLVRQNEWLKVLEDELALGDAFVTMGHGHLVPAPATGAEDILKFLEDKGFVVEYVGSTSVCSELLN